LLTLIRYYVGRREGPGFGSVHFEEDGAMAATSNQTWLVVLISVVVVVLAGYVLTSTLQGDKNNLGGITPVKTDLQVRIEKESKFKGLDVIYQDVPALRILPANRMINELGIDSPQVVAQIGAIEAAFLPHWKEKMGRRNEVIQQAYLKFREAQKNGDQVSMNAARKELADGVAAHNMTMEEMNKEYRQTILGLLNPEQTEKMTPKPVDPSPMPKL
jgi:hypothetical protein